VEFEYLQYLDISDCYVADYVAFHLNGSQPKIKSRLSLHAKFWDTLNAPYWLKQIIKYGVTVPFTAPPPKILLPNNKSAVTPEATTWIRNTLQEYESAGFIARVEKVPHCVSPLQIKNTGGKIALIYDMSLLNTYVEQQKFKIEGWEEMFRYSADAVAGIKFDIKKYYYGIDLHPDFQKYFGFMYVMDDNEPPTMFVWTVVPYGYTRAPFIARELMKPLIAKWRKMDAKVVVFYDDGMLVHENMAFLRKLSLQVQCDLLRAGLVPGVEKCVWIPEKIIDWNGLRFDFGRKGISILERRITAALEEMSTLKLSWPMHTYRKVARVVGKLLSMFPVFCGKEQIHTRMLQTIVNIRHYKNSCWDSCIEVDYRPLLDSALAELCRWQKMLVTKNFRSFSDPLVSHVAWTDASAIAIAGVVIKLSSRVKEPPICTSDLLPAGLVSRQLRDFVHLQIDATTETVQLQAEEKCLHRAAGACADKVWLAHRPLTFLEKYVDSNERELLAARHMLLSCGPFLCNSVLTCHFDNDNAAIICTKGSGKPRLQRYAVDIADLCDKFNICFRAVWIPRDLNKLADALSKSIDYEDYSVTEQFFDKVCSDFSLRPEIDCFATDWNAKVPAFFSAMYCPNTHGVNCFNYDWSVYTVCWLFPPPRLILKTFNYLKNCKAAGLLLTPEWRNSAFFPVLRNVQKPNLLRRQVYDGKNIFRRGSDADSYFGPNYTGNVVCWFFNFKH